MSEWRYHPNLSGVCSRCEKETGQGVYTDRETGLVFCTSCQNIEVTYETREGGR